jgi:hypothetical protein
MFPSLDRAMLGNAANLAAMQHEELWLYLGSRVKPAKLKNG